MKFKANQQRISGDAAPRCLAGHGKSAVGRDKIRCFWENAGAANRMGDDMVAAHGVNVHHNETPLDLERTTNYVIRSEMAARRDSIGKRHDENEQLKLCRWSRRYCVARIL